MKKLDLVLHYIIYYITPPPLKRFLSRCRANRIRGANLKFLDWLLLAEVIDEDGYNRLKSGDLSEYLHHTQIGLGFK